MDVVLETAKKLSDASLRKLYNPFDRVDYDDMLDDTKFHFSEEYISIFHEPEYVTLTFDEKKRLSLLEMVNYFSINIYGEQSLIQEFEKRLYRDGSICEGFAASQYLQKFIHEENSHTFMLAEYCHRYHGSLFRNKTIDTTRGELSFEATELLMYGRTLLLERFLAYFNKLIMHDDRVDRTTRACNRAHLLDEVRHIEWDRTVIGHYMSVLREKGNDAEIESIKSALAVYLDTAFKMLHNPKVYKLMDFDNNLELAKRSLLNPRRAAQISEWRKYVESELSKHSLY